MNCEFYGDNYMLIFGESFYTGIAAIYESRVGGVYLIYTGVPCFP